MPTRPEQFPTVALKYAKSPDVARLFGELAQRAETLARMRDEFLESITLHRATREGRPFRPTKREQSMLAGFDCDADKAVQELERHAAIMDDAALLSTALSCVHQAVRLDEHLFPGLRDQDKPMATRLLDYQRETMRLIEQFAESPPFKGNVRSFWH